MAQQQERREALADSAMQQEHFNTLLIRLQNLEGTVNNHHAALTADIGSFRMFAGQRFSAVTKSLNRVAVQAPVQMWHSMAKQQRARLEALGQQADEARARDEAARAEAVSDDEASVTDNARAVDGQGGRNQENRDPQRPNLPSNIRRRVRGPFVLGAQLSQSPKTLHDLWTEWEFGQGGLKPAKDFAAVERGRVKFACCRRKVFWDCVRAHLRAGYTAHAAVDKIYAAYGKSSSVSSILKRMQSDKKNGGHEMLRL